MSATNTEMEQSGIEVAVMLLAKMSATNTEMEQSGIEVAVLLLADEWR